MTIKNRFGHGRGVRGVTAVGVVSVMVASVGMSSALVASTANAAPSVNCAKYMAYMLPGTTETSMTGSTSKDSGMLGNVGEQLKAEFGDEINVVYVPYSASAFDKGLTYNASQKTGVKSAADLIGQCPDSEIVLAGYSQGADAMGDIAWHIGNENKPISSDKVRGVALLADPKRGGETAVGGSAKSGTSIAGGRPGGYGKLANRIKWICGDSDMYCNTTSKNPFAKVLGKLVVDGGSPTGVSALDGTSSVAPKPGADMSTLTSNFGDADLVGAKSKATDLKTRTQALAESGKAPTKDQVDEIGSLAKSLNSTYAAVEDTSDFAKTSGADKTLSDATSGTPEKATSSVLDAVGKTDMGALTSDTGAIADSASSLSKSLSSGDAGGVLTQGGDMFKDLALKAADVASQSDSLNSVDRSNLTAATGVLSTLKVSTVVDTGMMALTVGASTDYQGIFNDITTMIAQIQDVATHGGDVAYIKKVYETSQDLLDKIEPWVDLADSANAKIMPMAASMVAAVPDPQGISQIASMVMTLLSQVDIKAIWNTARSAYDITGQVIDGKPEALLGLAPLGLNLVSIGVGALTGQGGSDATAGRGAGASGPGLGGGGDLASLVGKLGAPQDFTQLATDGLDFMSFLHSGAHTSAYTNKKMVGNMSGVDYIGKYFIAQLRGEQESGSSSSKSDSDSSESGSSSGSGSSGSSSGSGSDSDSSNGQGDRGDRDSGDSERESRFSDGDSSSSSSSSSGSSRKVPAIASPSGGSRIASARGEKGVEPRVSAAVDDVAKSAGPTKLSVTVEDVDGGSAHTVGGSPNTYAASTIKVGVAAAVMRKVGVDGLNKKVQVNEVVGGANAISQTGSYPVSELLGAMIDKSCNTATNALIDFVGGFDPVNETIAAAGVKDGYSLKNKMMSTQDSILSSEGGAGFLRALWAAHEGNKKWLGQKEADVVIELMKQQTSRSKLPKDIPSAAVANKTGENTGVSHDIGYITKGDKTYAVAVTTTGQTNDTLISKIGAGVYNSMA